jgi:DNA-directed RNA polymerase specialized sigma24 family protein
MDHQDQKTFERDLIALIPHLRAFARSLCGDATAADDLAQDAVAKAWASRNSFAMGTNMKAWTFMILRNQFYSDKRRSWRSVAWIRKLPNAPWSPTPISTAPSPWTTCARRCRCCPRTNAKR